jgi:hypothetical protein
MKDEFTRQWITDNAINITRQYEMGVLTLRGLYYRLVAAGMTNTMLHYKRVVSAMIDARWRGIIAFDVFSDHDRAMIGETSWERTDLDESVEEAKKSIQLWMSYYRKNRWENQSIYPEVFIEKKALQGVFDPVCKQHDISLGACKGYPSLTFLYQAEQRFANAIYEGKSPVILYFGDYDPSGEDIPRSIEENLSRMGVDVEVKRISLLEEQVIEWDLPPAPVKISDSRSAKWQGLGQVELDAVAPDKIQRLCEDAILDIFDQELYSGLLITQEDEVSEYRSMLKKYVKTL